MLAPQQQNVIHSIFYDNEKSVKTEINIYRTSIQKQKTRMLLQDAPSAIMRIQNTSIVWPKFVTFCCSDLGFKASSKSNSQILTGVS